MNIDRFILESVPACSPEVRVNIYDVIGIRHANQSRSALEMRAFFVSKRGTKKILTLVNVFDHKDTK